MKRRIYVASSWRNDGQPIVVQALRRAGHAVYDFREPRPGEHGFLWAEIDPDWQSWSPREFRAALWHPVAVDGFESDWQAMQWADTGVLVMPSGRSAHLEAGYFTGAGKELFILLGRAQEPELMYRMATAVCFDLVGLLQRVGGDLPRCSCCGHVTERADGRCFACVPVP
jgi:hypothetical protein